MPVSHLTLFAFFLGLIFFAPWQSPSPVHAHPADQYRQLHEITFTDTHIELRWQLYPGTILAPSTWAEADIDMSDSISTDEAFRWAAPRLPFIIATLDDDNLLFWQVQDIIFPSSLTDFQLNNAPIEFILVADYPPFFSGQHQFKLQNRYEEATSTYWYKVTAGPNAAFYTPQPQNATLTLAFIIDLDAHPRPADTLLTSWDSGKPILSPALANADSGLGSANDRFGKLNDLLDQSNLVVIFFTALLLGSFHALTPGHGKALVGAYLVGSRGTFRHAIVLGLVVTITHTGSVMLIGALTLIASQFFVPTSIFPVLELASGLLIVLLGLFLLRQRWRGYRSVQRQRAKLAPKSPPATSPSVAATLASPSDSSNTERKRILINEPIKAKIYNDVLPTDSDKIRWRSLLGLGFSGGLVPCPEAIVTLLIAVALNRILMGISLILAFSSGMALVLVAIGLVIVKTSRTFTSSDRLSRLAPAISVLSSVVVLGLGLGLTWQAFQGSDWLIQAEARADTAINAQHAPSTDFRLADTQILFTAADDNGLQQLLVISALGGEPRQLTAEPNGIGNFDPSPDAKTIIYSIHPPNPNSGLWVIDADGSNRRLALSCIEEDCGNPIWTPDGRDVIYERIAIADPYTPDYGIISLWKLSATDGSTQALFQDQTFQGLSAEWSPDGQWLSYISPQSIGIQLYNLVSGASITVPSQTSPLLVWKPDSTAVLYFDTELDDSGQMRRRLKHFNLRDNSTIALFADNNMEERWAAWSPDGEKIVVIRGQLQNGVLQGDQIWLANPDGSNAHVLIESGSMIYGIPQWSPDSRYLILTQYRLDAPRADTELILVDTRTPTVWTLYAPAYNPVWLP